MSTYTKEYLLQNPPNSVKHPEVWSYVINKSCTEDDIPSIPYLVKYYHTKVNYLKNKNQL